MSDWTPVAGLRTHMLVSTGAAIFMIVSAFGFSATALILIILAGIKPVERRLFTDQRQRTITLLIDRQGASLLAVEAAIEETGLRPQHTLIQRGDRLEEDRVQIALNHAPNKMLLPLAERLRQISGVREISDSVMEPSVTTRAHYRTIRSAPILHRLFQFLLRGSQKAG